VKIFKKLQFLMVFGLALAVFASPCAAQNNATWGQAGRPLIVDFLDVGQGDAILIRSPEGKIALIDAGPSKDGAAEQLRKRGLTAVDIVILSHHHTDHFGGMGQVIREFKPRYFMASGSSHTTKSYLRLLETVKEEGVTMVEPTEKLRKIELGSVLLTILPQPPENTKEENDNSIAVRLQYGEFSVLMTGDSEEGSRTWWRSKASALLSDCTILKLAHHGSHNGTDQEWLNITQPQLAVASLGFDNSYGHPHQETVSLLRKNKIPLVRTDQWGTITIVSNGKIWNLIDPKLARRDSRGRENLAGRMVDDDAPPRRQSRTAARRR
jgi:beta-lactamase superfamily II metal-dependent hydrolase